MENDLNRRLQWMNIRWKVLEFGFKNATCCNFSLLPPIRAPKDWEELNILMANDFPQVEALVEEIEK